jgi:hypothetical protein
MNRRKRTGPSTVPWGTPETTGSASDLSLLPVGEEVANPRVGAASNTIVV